MTDIFINGEIGGDSWDGQGEFGIIGSKFIQNQLAESDEEVTVHINSPGGEVGEGYAIHDILKSSEKEITTIIEGNCSSIATVVLLAADKKNRQATENSTGMIHNPWMLAIGDADQIQEDVDRLKDVEAKLLDFYVKKTGANRDELENLMAEEKEMTANELLDLGFIGKVSETIKGLKRPNKIFAKAYLTRNMKQEKETKTIKAMLDGFMTKFTALVNKKPIVNKKHDDDDDDKNKVKTDIKGEEQQLEDGTRIFINGDEGNFTGKEVWVIGEDGSLGDPLPDGDHTLGDGRTLRIGGGTVSEVVEQMETTEDPNALKNQVAKLQAEVTRLKENHISAGLEKELLSELETIKRGIVSQGAPVQGSGNFTEKVGPQTKRQKVFSKAQKIWEEKNNHKSKIR